MMQRQKHKTYKSNVFLVLGAATFVAVSFFYGPVISLPFQRVFGAAFTPVFEKMSSFAGAVSYGSAFFMPRKQLVYENKALMSENKELTGRVASLLFAQRENEELKKLLGLKAGLPQAEFIPAHPVGFVREGRDEYIYISRGTQDGVYSDLFVIDGKSVLAGRVVEAHPSSAKIKLITSGTEAVNGILEGPDIGVLVRGNNFRELVIDLVPENAAVSGGEEIVFSETKDTIGFSPLIGRIVTVGSSEGRIFKVVTAIHDFDPQSLDPVFVVKRRQ